MTLYKCGMTALRDCGNVSSRAHPRGVYVRRDHYLAHDSVHVRLDFTQGLRYTGLLVRTSEEYVWDSILLTCDMNPFK